MRKVKDIKKELEELDRKHQGSYKIFGKQLLTRGDMNTGPRLLMVSSHLDQFVQTNGVEIPVYSTGWENTVANYSDSYKEAEDDLVVIKKITKFPLYHNSPYMLLVYNKNKEQYDIIERMALENLTEHYCYRYDNSYIDGLQNGDVINTGDVMYKSESFDKYGNYRFGVNGIVMYWSTTKTTEDAIIVGEPLAKKLASPEADTIRVSINNNDILINKYGTSDTIKSFPDIGEEVEDNIVCCSRRKNYDNILYDLDNSRLSKINVNTDTPYYGNGEIIDIEIYCNNPEYLDEECNAQLKRYYMNNKRYYTEIYEELSKYIDTENTSDDIKFYYKKAKEIVVDNKEYRDGDKKFSNIILEFKTLSQSYILRGNKLVCRYGDKGVVSRVLPEDEMPICENGVRVDMICNQGGVVGRLNPIQLMERDISFVCMQVLERCATLDTYQERAELIYRFLNIVDKDLYSKLKNIEGKSKDELYKIIDAFMKQGRIHITQAPYWSDFGLDAFTYLCNHFDFIKKYKAYMKVRGEYRELHAPVVIGYKYILKLKHTPASKFSARSVSYVNSKNIPSKSNSYKNNKSLYSTAPVRIGEMEFSILSIGIDYQLVTKMNLEHSSSVMARKKLNDSLYTKDIYKDIGVDIDGMSNRNAEIMNAYMKTIGLGIKFTEVDSIDRADLIDTKNWFVNPVSTIEVGNDKMGFNPIKNLSYINPIISGIKKL